MSAGCRELRNATFEGKNMPTSIAQLQFRTLFIIQTRLTFTCTQGCAKSNDNDTYDASECSIWCRSGTLRVGAAYGSPELKIVMSPPHFLYGQPDLPYEVRYIKEGHISQINPQSNKFFKKASKSVMFCTVFSYKVNTRLHDPACWLPLAAMRSSRNLVFTFQLSTVLQSTS